jgi:hypothetical protein
LVGSIHIPTLLARVISKSVVIDCFFAEPVVSVGDAGELSIVKVASRSSKLNAIEDGLSFQTVSDSVKPNLFQKNGFNFLAGREAFCLRFNLN